MSIPEITICPAGAFYDDKHTLSGGTVCTSYNSVTVGNTTFEGCEAAYGGGFYVPNSTKIGALELKDVIARNGKASSFINSDNETTGGRGADMSIASLVPGGTIKLDNVQVYGNRSDQEGGGIFIDCYGNTSITFIGGGIVADVSTNLTINDSVISYNVARTGGITISGNSAVTMQNTQVTFNDTCLGGGGVYVAGETSNVLNATGCTIADNETGLGETGIYLVGNKRVVAITDDDEITANDEIIIDEEDGTRRKVINAVTVSGGLITRNKASHYGGGIANLANAKVLIQGGELIVNEGHIFNNKAVAPATAELGKTGYRKGETYGAGGGICVIGHGRTATIEVPNKATFELKGENVGIYGNTATFSGDEVFANGLNMKSINNHSLDQYPVKRYRNSTASDREEIEDQYVTGLVNLDDAYVAMALGIPNAADDTVVVDYGMNVEIDLLANDTLFGENATGGYDVGMDPKEYSILGTALPDDLEADKEIIFGSGEDTNVTRDLNQDALKMGKVNWKKDGNEQDTGILLITVNGMQMDSEEVFFYAAPGKKYYYYASVTVVPATAIYYDDNDTFVNYHEGEWKPVGDASAGIQDQDRPGSSIMEGLDADNVYGYDSSHASSTTYSGGTAHKVQVTQSTSARASFTFTGTGFDIVSLCSNKSATVLVNVFRGKITNFNDPSIYNEATYVVPYYVDTYYGYKYENGQWVVDPKADEYDPVYKNFGYGTYTVELVVGTSWTVGAPNAQNAEFYLDAIRIYNPAGIGSSVGDVIQDAYLSDGEGWPVYAELRDMFIEQGNLTDANPLEGILFIDGQEKPTLADYKSWGPNNEIYLKPGQSLAFTMDTDNYGQDIAAIHLGVRGLTGMGNVLVQAKDKTNSSASAETVLNRKVSTTDMYYDISNIVLFTIASIGNRY